MTPRWRRDCALWRREPPPPSQGTEGIAWLCVAPRDEIKGGSFYLDRKPQTKHIAGPFFSEGRRTKNSEAEVDAMMEALAAAVAK